MVTHHGRPLPDGGNMKTKMKLELDPYLDEYLGWSFDLQITWAIGKICLGIGRGDVRSAVWEIIDRERRSTYRRIAKEAYYGKKS